MKKYEELTNEEKNLITELACDIYNECSYWIFKKEDYTTMCKYFNKLKELING